MYIANIHLQEKDGILVHQNSSEFWRYLTEEEITLIKDEMRMVQVLLEPYSEITEEHRSEQLNNHTDDGLKIQYKESGSKQTQVYIMKDHHTGYYKIGNSLNPNVREKTLQAQLPKLELVFSYPATEKDERKLHAAYSHLRLRGEWFKLSSKDLKMIEFYLKMIQK